MYIKTCGNYILLFHFFFSVNAVNPSEVQRTVIDVKKKWQDLQSITKKKEAARVKAVRETGGGPAPQDNSKPWEQVVCIHCFILIFLL